MKIYCSMAGGIGDFILQILECGWEFGQLAALKARYPEAETCVHAFVVTEESKNLLAGHAFVDRVVFHDFSRMWESEASQAALSEGYRKMTGVERGEATWVRPDWPLNDIEQELARSVIDGPPYVVFHPFAGDDYRKFSANNLSPEKAALAMCEAGARVVLLGGNSPRWTENDGPIEKIDDFDADCDHENLVDLRGQGTCRLPAHIVKHAKAFIGTTSAYNCAAHMYGIPALTFTAGFIRKHVLRDVGGIFWMMRNSPTTRVLYYDGLPIDTYGTIADFAAEHVE